LRDLGRIAIGHIGADREPRGCWRGPRGAVKGTGENVSMTKTILIADDEEFIVDLLATLLEDEHYRVLRAYDGEQALQAARMERPELIITDIMMPKLSGTDLAARLRAEEEESGEATPIILMSAVRSPIAVPNTIYLPKPFDIDHVLELVTLLLPS
jgi:DNA-binding response OmpR family regulator